MNTTIAGLQIPDNDLCHVQWRAQAWIVENGPLNESNAMDYFALSPFYDRKSTNQVLRMQTMFSGQPKLDHTSEKEALRRFVGIEYALVLSRPEVDREGGLFVIEKRDRKGYDEHYPMASYYILKASIYQAPSLYATLSARVLTCLSALKQLLELAREHKPAYDSRQSYAWKIKEKIEHPDQALDKLSTDHRPESTHPAQESEQMDTDPSSHNKEPTSKATSNKPTSDTHELTNPILLRALQSTMSNFPGFKPPTLTDHALAPLGISTSQAPSPRNPPQLSAASFGSHDIPPTPSNQFHSQTPARTDSQQEGHEKTSSVATKGPIKAAGTGSSKKKQKQST